MKDFEEQRVSHGLKPALSLGSVALFALGFVLGAFLGRVTPGVLVFAAGAILFAVRGYLTTGDKAVSAVLVFVALSTIGIQAIVFFLGP